MSRTIHCSNELSPWPRLLLSGASQQGGGERQVSGEGNNSASDRSSRGHCPHLTSRPKGLRGRISSVMSSNSNSARPNGRRTSFSSTKQYNAIRDDKPIQPLNRQQSGREVQRLLELKERKLKEAKRNGDISEVHRLKNLHLFDDIERLEIGDATPGHTQSGERFSDEDTQYEVASDTGSEIRGSTLGHTPELCWHMQLQYAHGALIPEEFIKCNIHPALEAPATPTRSTTPNIVQSPSSSKTSTSFTQSGPLSRRTRTSSISSSTIQGSATVSTPAKADEEDPFLYIGKYILHHSKKSRNLEKTKPNRTQALQAAVTRREHSPECVCSNHECRDYLSGKVSKHCRFCRFPGPQPEIQAAVARIESIDESQMSVDTDISLPLRIELADELRCFEDLQEDTKLIEMYNAEMEKRCREGVWWEGWLIVEELKKQGIVGSIPYVYARGDGGM